MTQSSQPQTGVLFDIDGTLVDSNYQHAYAWWRALQEAGHRVPMFEIHRRIGMGSDYLLEELIGEFSEGLSEARARHFRPLRSELMPFEGAAELLRAVHGQGSKVVLATSANKEDLKVLLEVIDAEDAIDQVTSAADVEHSKPSPDVFERALEISGLSPERSIVVGDTAWDIEAAKRIGLRCVCVESGGWSPKDLLAAGAVAVFATVKELLDRLDESPVGALLQRARVGA